MIRFLPVAISIPVLLFQVASTVAQELRDQARESLQKGVLFFQRAVAVEGGYVYQVSSDLKYREGEGVADAGTVWVQPPGTPAVGMALLNGYERTGEKTLLDAARNAGLCLVRGQLHSGGWQAHIDFGRELRPKHAYRVEGQPGKKARNLSSLDDDKTQSAVRFLSRLDKTLQFKDEIIHESCTYALQSLLANQFPNGGWGQVYHFIDDPKKYPVKPANYPDQWPREYPGGDYWFFYTLNDNNITQLIDTLLLAAEIYGDARYRESAIRAADFLLLAQMPDPQPAWAQQYNFEMQPVWARKFEPPAVSGGESQDAIKSLMKIFVETGDRKYLASIPRALDYLENSLLPNGRLARFYELQTNKPLYFTKEYQLTYSSDDLPTHYGFTVPSNLPKLRRDYTKISKMSDEERRAYAASERIRSGPKRPTAEEIIAILRNQDSRGAWVEKGKLKYHKGLENIDSVIKSETFIENIDKLSRFLVEPE